MENEMKKGGLEDTDQKAGDGQKEGGLVLSDTVLIVHLIFLMNLHRLL